MTASKNDLVYHYAVMRCKESQFLALDPSDIIAYRKRDFQIDVLIPNAKVFSIFMFVWGFFVAIIPEETLQMYYVMTGIVGFSVNAAFGIGNEFTSKWGKYKLTLPVKRTDIVESLFLSQIIWLLVGLLFSGTGITLSFLLHGYSYDQLIGMLCAFGIASVLFNVTDAAPLLGTALSIICSLLAFCISYPLTVSIYKKKEY